MDFDFGGLDWQASVLATTFVRVRIRCRLSCWYWTSRSWCMIETKDDWTSSEPDQWQYSSAVHHPSNTPENQEESLSYMHENDISHYKEGIGCPRYTKWRLPRSPKRVPPTEPKNGEKQITAQSSVQDEARDSYWWQASSALALPGSAYNYDKNGFLTRTAPVEGEV